MCTLGRSGCNRGGEVLGSGGGGGGELGGGMGLDVGRGGVGGRGGVVRVVVFSGRGRGDEVDDDGAQLVVRVL
jgi:hypothetical protein